MYFISIIILCTICVYAAADVYMQYAHAHQPTVRVQSSPRSDLLPTVPSQRTISAAEQSNS